MIERINELVLIKDGPTIRLEGRPAQGTQHDVAFGVVTDTGELVAVKIERTPGALQREAAALAWLNTQHSPAPRLLAAATTEIDGKPVGCLVTDRCRGSPPETIAGWRRMGRAYARLPKSRDLLAGLTVLDAVTFGQEHAERVRDLGTRLASLSESTADWERLISPVVPGSPQLVLTHGDHGPRNFLDDGRDGTLIDWEQAHVAPRGLDLARLVFIALLGAGPSGYLARDHQQRAHAAICGYLSALSDDWRPSRLESRWWTTVAGIQFIHRRWELGGRPAPWQDAADVLQEALTDDLAWESR